MPTTRGAHRDFAALEARRFQAARLFGRGVAQVTVARELGVSRTTTHRWYYAWQAEGRRGLKAVGRAGRKPRLDRQQWAQVEAALLKGPAARPPSCTTPGRTGNGCRSPPRSRFGGMVAAPACTFKPTRARIPTRRSSPSCAP